MAVTVGKPAKVWPLSIAEGNARRAAARDLQQAKLRSLAVQSALWTAGSTAMIVTAIAVALGSAGR
ncbi:MAG TPA: hypothetical protein VN814_02260 [Caulobacteraceae bacterium]|nr:hypothetical protein [Caulobacteraceae bacterium]